MSKESPVTAAFVRSLQELRQLRRINQLDLAQKTGMQPSAISHFENGRRTPSLDNLVKLADALEVTVDRLIGRQAEENPATYPAQRLTTELIRNCMLLGEFDLRLIADLVRSLAEKRPGTP